ncbi:MAG: cytochrome c family protein [Pyrinomonadaceae bacterium]
MKNRIIICVFVFSGNAALAQHQPDGQQLFKQRCSVCHSIAPSKSGMGPSLAGVFGRQAASAPGFNYSPAIKATNITWDTATLDKFLSAPRKAVPGSRMLVSMPDEKQRSAVIAYLKTLR